MDKYIHYWHGSSNEFSLEIFNPVKNDINLTKPSGGFWASRIDAQYSWKDWTSNRIIKYFKCDDSRSFTFTINEDSKILRINSILDLVGLPSLTPFRTRLRLSSNYGNNEIDYTKLVQTNKVELEYVTNGNEFDWVRLDFEKLSETYDAIEVNISSDYMLHHKLFTWDCDSILIMNPKIIQN